jgi:hypothetical protein
LASAYQVSRLNVDVPPSTWSAIAVNTADQKNRTPTATNADDTRIPTGPVTKA